VEGGRHGEVTYEARDTGLRAAVDLRCHYVHELIDASPRAAWMFTSATIDHDPSADRYRDEIIKRWGPRAVVTYRG
jgi:hypothetical protein